MGYPMTITAGPLVAADDDAVSASQKAAGAQSLVINGAKSDGGTANNICLSQTPAGVGVLTLNGSLVVSGVAYLSRADSVARTIYITSAGNDSGVTFAILGTLKGTNATETVTGSNTSVVGTTKVFDTIISITISGAAAAAVTVGRGGIATLDVQRRIIFTSGGDDTGITFTPTGTNGSGSAISETVTGVNAGAASTVLDYKTITSVVTSGAVATTVIVGTNGVAGSQWAYFDDFAGMAPVSIQCTVSGTANYTVQQTMQNPTPGPNAVAYSALAWVSHPDSALVAATTTAQGNYAYPPIFARVVLNSESGTGAVSAIFRQVYTY